MRKWGNHARPNGTKNVSELGKMEGKSTDEWGTKPDNTEKEYQTRYVMGLESRTSAGCWVDGGPSKANH